MKISSHKGQVEIKSTLTKYHCEELIKCLKDPIYFINTYYKVNNFITAGTSGSITLRPNQEELITSFRDDNTLSLNCRQAGTTTAGLAYLLWVALFQSNQKVVYVSPNNSMSRNANEAIRYAYDNLPSWMKQPTTRKNYNNIQFQNSSYIYFIIASGNALRGQTINVLFVDDFAHSNHDSQESAIFYSSAHNFCRSLFASTACNKKNLFFKLWEKGLGFKKIKTTVYELNHITIQSRSLLKHALGETGFKHECDCEFTE
jgi:hypothetical protein